MRAALAFTCLATLAACSAGGPFLLNGVSRGEANPFAPGLNTRAEAVDGLRVGHRLMAADEHELALDAFRRAAATEGLTADVLSALGSANLALGRLGQAEDLLRRAVKADETSPEAWNNLGVVLMERGKTAEAGQIFRKAYGLDNGQSDAIRDNLRTALAKIENSSFVGDRDQEYKLVRRGSSDFLIRTTP